jgi:hypothetical protein
MGANFMNVGDKIQLMLDGRLVDRDKFYTVTCISPMNEFEEYFGVTEVDGDLVLVRFGELGDRWSGDGVDLVKHLQTAMNNVSILKLLENK